MLCGPRRHARALRVFAQGAAQRWGGPRGAVSALRRSRGARLRRGLVLFVLLRCSEVCNVLMRKGCLELVGFKPPQRLGR